MLKWLAMVLMVIDHVAYYFHDHISETLYYLMRTAGRLAFPIFAYGIVLGVRRTRNVFRYFLRLALFAVAGQLLMDTAARRVGRTAFTNVLFTLTAGLLIIVGIDLVTRAMRDVVMTLRPAAAGPHTREPFYFNVRVSLKGITMPRWMGIFLGTLLIVSSISIAVILEPDYGLFGVSVMLLFYMLENQLEPYTPTLSASLKQKRLSAFFISFGLLNLLNMALTIWQNPRSDTWALISTFSTFSIFLFPLGTREDKRPAPWQKYFFYVFYPAHLALLIVLSALF